MNVPSKISSLSLLLALASGCATQSSIAAESDQSQRPLPHPDLTLVRDGKTVTSIADVVEKAAPSVVSVWSKRTQKVSTRGPLDDFHRFFGERPESLEREQQGLGSGVVISKDGYVLTNNHVVEGAEEVRITTPDKRELDAKVVGSDPKSDLAVLKIEGDVTGLVPIRVGNSDNLRLGDVVIAIGNPFGLGQTVTMGIVSAKGRGGMGIVDYEDFIQTDAAINPGNSGGALINTKGELVGINTAIFSRTGGSLGIGFAVPTTMAKPIMESLIEHGKVVRGWLGVGIQDLERELAEAMNLEPHSGVLVSGVQDGSPAAKAGFKTGDVILKVSGEPVKSSVALRNRIAAAGANVKVDIDVLRDGKRKTLQVELGKLESDEAEKRPGAAPGSSGGKLDGLQLGELTPAVRQRLQLDRDIDGVVITAVKPGSTAARAGLRPGDVVVEMNRNEVQSIGSFEQHWREAKGKVLLLVYRGGQTRFVVIAKDEK